MGLRIDLHSILCDIVATNHVYFQPPETIKMVYPCIVYKRNKLETRYANNGSYTQTKGYTITVIDKNPDSTIPDKVASLPMCQFVDRFTKDNLNHDIFRIYY